MKRLIALCILTAALLPAAAAKADSLVFVRNNNVWLANADGSGQYQVTLDGTPSSPYSSPSQADDGTIVALRTPAGGRPEIWRMHQNGGLLNPPINTPAPGTGAIDARVSPDGTLVAYWFVTEVSTGTCLYCFNVSSRVLISHVDRFTSPDEVGTPHTGSLPSWMSNDTLLLSNGNATQWYYTLGMPEAAQWWGDTDNCGCVNPVGLSDGEVSRDGQRIALVRGDSSETIVIYAANGAPPAVPTPRCQFTGANGGKFSGPTWSQNGQTLAWQEGNGIWSAQMTGFPAACPSGSQLIVPGGSTPDFGPAAVNPGPRPGCGNPGNPTACTTPGPGPGTGSGPGSGTRPGPGPTPGASPSLAHQLSAFLSSCARAIKRLAIHGLVRKHHVTLAFTAPRSGKLTLSLSSVGRHPVILATAQARFTRTGKRRITLAVTKAGLRTLGRARSLHGVLRVTFAPRRGASRAAKLRVSLSK